MARVLEYPARRTGSGAGDHHGGGLSGVTHGARDVAVGYFAYMQVPLTIDFTVITFALNVVEHWKFGQTQMVGAAASIQVFLSRSNP